MKRVEKFKELHKKLELENRRLQELYNQGKATVEVTRFIIKSFGGKHGKKPIIPKSF